MARSASKSKKKAKPPAAKGKAAKGKKAVKSSQGNKAKPAKTITAWDGTTKIVTATLPALKRAENGKGEMDSQKLVRIPSKAVRATIINEAALAIAARESLALPSHGGRPWKCDVKLVDDARGKRKMSGPLFRWYRGRLELACLPHILDKVPEVDHRAPAKRRHRDDPSDDESSDEESDDEYPHIPRTSLQERQVSSLSSVAWECPDHPIPTVKRTWVSPDAITFHSRKAAENHAEVLVKRDTLIDKVLHGYGGHGLMLRPAKPTKKAALEAGLACFLRDGLWVVGQEEEWLEEALEVWKVREGNRERRAEREAAEEEEEEEEASGDVESRGEVTALDLYIESNRDKLVEVEEQVSDVENKKSPKPSGGDGAASDSGSTTDKKDGNEKRKKRFTVEDATKELRLQWEGMGEGERQPYVALAASRNSGGGSSKDKTEGGTATSVQSAQKKRKVEGTAATVAVSPTDSGADKAGEARAASAAPAAGPAAEGMIPAAAAAPPPAPAQAGGGEGIRSPTPRLVSPLPTDASDTVNDAAIAAAIGTAPSPETIRRRRPTKPRKAPKIAPSTHWRLTAPQIDACYSAVMEHYERVMYTVKARNLFFELADGFDVLRERGRGRYDMELSAFDTPAFDFLTDPSKAAWMPVVRKILGDDAKLVHKGAFLSLPGSDTQVYHQDGVHLTTKYQRPCHAVNVFIPLVDLHERNGPTEFCHGTHYLGYENHVRNMCYTPTPPAGTPIIFDYRLGHRGMGNSSDESRPVVYLTYTPASKEFKDSVNFSRKRYKKLGDLVDRPLSRRERAMKRETEAAAERQAKDARNDTKEVSATTSTETGAVTTEASATTCTSTETGMTQAS